MDRTLEVDQSAPINEVVKPEAKHLEVDVGTSFFNQRYLFAFANRGELIHHLRTQTHKDEAARFPEILGLWEAQQPVVQRLTQTESGAADQVVLEELPIELSPRLREISADPLLGKTFSQLPITFSLVEIDKLVAAQRTVNLDYVELLKARYGGKTSLADLVEICLSPVREMPPIQHLEVANNTHVFSSRNLDVRFLGAFLKNLAPDDLEYAELGGIPAAAVIAFVGYGGAPINVLKFQNRAVLNNGFHRVFALRSLGIEKIPVVVQHVRNYQLEYPPQVGGFPRDYLLGSLRPVLMKDFLNEDFCIKLKAKDRMKVVTVQTPFSAHDVPA